MLQRLSALLLVLLLLGCFESKQDLIADREAATPLPDKFTVVAYEERGGNLVPKIDDQGNVQRFLIERHGSDYSAFEGTNKKIYRARKIHKDVYLFRMLDATNLRPESYPYTFMRMNGDFLSFWMDPGDALERIKRLHTSAQLTKKEASLFQSIINTKSTFNTIHLDNFEDAVLLYDLIFSGIPPQGWFKIEPSNYPTDNEKNKQSSSSAWETGYTTDPMTDSKQWEAYTQSTRENESTPDVVLQINCSNKGEEAVLFWHKKLVDIYPDGDMNGVITTVRFDKQPARRFAWGVERNWQTVYSLDPSAAGLLKMGNDLTCIVDSNVCNLEFGWRDDFISSLAMHNKLIVQTPLAQGGLAYAYFDLNGAGKAIAQMRAQCNK